MMTTLWQLPPEITPMLGPWGTGILLFIMIAQGVMTLYSWRKSTAIKILQDELTAYKGKTDRQDRDIGDLQVEHADCKRQLERLTRLYLESKGEEEDQAPRRSGEHRRGRA